MRKKIEELRKKQIDFTTLSGNLDIFRENCKIADSNVAYVISTLTGDFKKTYGIKENVMTNFFVYAGVFLGNLTDFGRFIKDCCDAIEDVFTAAIDAVMDWYKYGGGKYIVEAVIEFVEGAIVIGLMVIAIVLAPELSLLVELATSIEIGNVVMDTLSSVYNDMRAYQAAKNGDASWAERCASVDTFTETIRKTSDSQAMHTVVDVIDVIEFTASAILIMDAVYEIGKGLKNVVTRMKNGKVKFPGSAVEGGSGTHGNSETSALLDGRLELTGSVREKLLATVQDSKLRSIVNEIYRPGATVGDGGTADILIKEYYEGSSKHLIKAKGRLIELKKLAKSGKLGLNDLDIIEALITDLENAISLFD